MVIETMLAAIYVLLQPLLPPLLLPPTKPPTPKEHHIRVAFKGGRVYPGRAGASQPETNENHQSHWKPYKSEKLVHVTVDFLQATEAGTCYGRFVASSGSWYMLR